MFERSDTLGGMLSVYVETTIPSYYYSSRTSTQARAWQAATRDWWDSRRADYRLATSGLVEQELRRAPAERAAPRLRLLDGLPRVPISDQALEVASEYIRHKLMPKELESDALHVALASVHGLDVLLTWNCKHMANGNKIPHLTAINGRLGLGVPQIVTPYHLLEYPA